MKSLLEHHGISKKASEVDFVIPFLDIDRCYFIDPSLIRFSDEPRFSDWLSTIETYTQLINDYIGVDDRDGLRKVLDTGEANAIGLGYTQTSINGSGVGSIIAESLIEILITHPDFKKHGITRFEQLQLLDVGIADDRISDLVAHILKEHLINYTQEQCRVVGIPMERVRIGKVFDYADHEWKEQTVHLPINPEQISRRDALNPHPPILLVPKEILRPLPIFLNYNSFLGFLRKEHELVSNANPAKELVVSRNRDDLALTERYVSYRESQRGKRLYRLDFGKDLLELADEIDLMKIGQESRDLFRDKVGKALEQVFLGDLRLMGQEVRTALASSRRDLVFLNAAGAGILKTIKEVHTSSHLIVDTKNVQHLDADDVKQVAGYLNDRSGMVGIIVIPGEPTSANITAAKDIYLHEKKVLLIISKQKLVGSLRGASRIQALSGEDVPYRSPEAWLEAAYSEIVLA